MPLFEQLVGAGEERCEDLRQICSAGIGLSIFNVSVLGKQEHPRNQAFNA